MAPLPAAMGTQTPVTAAVSPPTPNSGHETPMLPRTAGTFGGHVFSGGATDASIAAAPAPAGNSTMLVGIPTSSPLAPSPPTALGHTVAYDASFEGSVKAALKTLNVQMTILSEQVGFQSEMLAKMETNAARARALYAGSGPEPLASRVDGLERAIAKIVESQACMARISSEHGRQISKLTTVKLAMHCVPTLLVACVHWLGRKFMGLA